MSDTPVRPESPDQTRTFQTQDESAEITDGSKTLLGSDEPMAEQIGDYRIIAKLGEGGMGAVYRAEDIRLKREVALKVMRAEIAQHPASRERFVREARAVAKLKHDHIVTIYYVGEENGTPFLAMELLDGMSLSDHLNAKKPLSWLDILRIGRDIARGLALAHSKGMIHRDIKPGNIWLETQDQSIDGVPSNAFRVKILDFGLARPISDNVHLTASGTICGTPSYMAPEQASGDALDGRCDLFSLGVLLYKLCSGRLPFQGKDVLAMVTALALKDPEPLSRLAPETPVKLQQLIHRLLAKNPDDRPASAQLVVTELQTIITELDPASNTVPMATPVAGLPDPWAGIDDETNATEQIEREQSPETTVEAKPGRSRNRLLVAVGLLALIPLGWWLATVILRVETENGTLVVKIDDPEIEARIKNGKLILTGPDDKVRYTLSLSERDKKIDAGPYKIRVEGADGLTLDTPEFTLKKGDTVTVRVTAKPKAVAVAKSIDPDRSAAEWVLSLGGTICLNEQDPWKKGAAISALPTCRQTCFG